MKNALREKMQSKRVPRGASEAIQQRLIEQDWWTAAFQVGIYIATAREPETGSLLADLHSQGARVAVPVRRGPGYGWGWVEENTRWTKGAHGIREPALASKASSEELRVIVVPGVAFDAEGGRLGHGRGHFDRLLTRSRALRVGLCFENRLLGAVPMESHDVRMDVVVTEKRMIYAPSAERKIDHLTG